MHTIFELLKENNLDVYQLFDNLLSYSASDSNNKQNNQMITPTQYPDLLSEYQILRCISRQEG